MAPIDENPHLFSKHDFENSQCHQYERLNVISYGAYGVVYKARDKETGEIVAMKMLLEVNELSQTLEEIDIHKSLPRHPSVVGFKRAATDRRSRVFVVMEYVENDLNTLIYEKRKPFTNIRDIKHVMKQLLEGVAFLHDKGVMHRDLKPANILINDKGKLKICDFGLSARFGGTTRGSCDPHVGTMWYKAPELLLGRQTHSSAVDMWSVGCIMAELVLSEPLFRGSSEAHQLAHIHGTVGTSCNRLRAKLGGVGSSFSGMRSLTLTPSGLDLLERLLAYYPDMRITAREALNHRWFKEDLFGLHRIGDLYAWCNKKLKINFRR